MTIQPRVGRGPTTIADVAKLAHVSITTVSHVLSGKRPVAEATRRRVLEATQELNYRPAMTARGLATGRAMALGLQFPFEGEQLLLNPYFPAVLESLSAAAIEAGFTFVLLPARRSEAFPLDILLESQQLDAAIVVDPMDTNDLIPTLRTAGLPVVTIGRYLGRARTLSVDSDSAGGVREAILHLAEQGYRRPALISHLTDRYSYIADIERGFRDAVGQARIRPIIERAADLSERAGYDAAIDLLGRRHPPDAIVAAVERQAIGVLAAARELGLRVPQDLGVIGGGNSYLARAATPSLTSIDVQPDQQGSAAVELARLAIDAAAGQAPSPDSMTIEARLEVRDSTRRRR